MESTCAQTMPGRMKIRMKMSSLSPASPSHRAKRAVSRSSCACLSGLLFTIKSFVSSDCPVQSLVCAVCLYAQTPVSCVCEREREREGGRERDREGEKERERQRAKERQRERGRERGREGERECNIYKCTYTVLCTYTYISL